MDAKSFWHTMLVWVACLGCLLPLNAASEDEQSLPEDTTQNPSDSQPDPQQSEREEVTDFLDRRGIPKEREIQLVDDSQDTWSFLGSVIVDYRHEDNFDLDSSFDANDAETTIEGALGILYQHNDALRAYVELELTRDYVLNGDDDHDSSLTIEEAYVHFDEFWGDWSFRLGRQSITDDREWFYDESLDAAALFYKNHDMHIQFVASHASVIDQDLLHGGSADEVDEIHSYIHSLERDFTDWLTLGYFFVYRDDRDFDSSQHYFGIRATGDIGDGWNYWADIARVGGDDGSDSIDAYGYDVGATYFFDYQWEPRITLAYAFGSGDSNLDDNQDKEFRQTGLESNTGHYGGFTDFRYYGELMSPELSNIRINTVGLGFAPTPDSSVDLVYHRYRQDELSDFLLGSDLDLDPLGNSRDLGYEFDLVMSWEIGEALYVDAIVGYFEPGDAFSSDAGSAYSANIVAFYLF